jgi:hypothetical protein
VGVRTAELVELPLMLGVIVVAARWINQRVGSEAAGSRRLAIGLSALALLLVAELALGVALEGESIWNVLFDRDPVSGTAYYAGLCLFGLMPWWLARGGGGEGQA